eukprot:gene3567-3835_t
MSTQWLLHGSGDCYKSLRDGPSLPAADQPRVQDGVHFVVYSKHSSRTELVEVLKALQPRAVMPFCGSADAVLRQHLGSAEARELVLQEIQASVAAAKAEAYAGSGGCLQDGGCWQQGGHSAEHESEEGSGLFEGLEVEPDAEVLQQHQQLGAVGQGKQHEIGWLRGYLTAGFGSFVEMHILTTVRSHAPRISREALAVALPTACLFFGYAYSASGSPARTPEYVTSMEWLFAVLTALVGETVAVEYKLEYTGKLIPITYVIVTGVTVLTDLQEVAWILTFLG